MSYRMSGIVTFEFSLIDIEGTDPQEAIHEVETMSLGELFEFADGAVDVQVTRQTVIP